MSEPMTTSPERQRRLEQVIAEYLLAADAGRPPETTAFLDGYPDLATDLVELLAAQADLARLVAPLRDLFSAPLCSDTALQTSTARLIGLSRPSRTALIRYSDAGLLRPVGLNPP